MSNLLESHNDLVRPPILRDVSIIEQNEIDAQMDYGVVVEFYGAYRDSVAGQIVFAIEDVEQLCNEQMWEKGLLDFADVFTVSREVAFILEERYKSHSINISTQKLTAEVSKLFWITY